MSVLCNLTSSFPVPIACVGKLILLGKNLDSFRLTWMLLFRKKEETTNMYETWYPRSYEEITMPFKYAKEHCIKCLQNILMRNGIHSSSEFFGRIAKSKKYTNWPVDSSMSRKCCFINIFLHYFRLPIDAVCIENCKYSFVPQKIFIVFHTWNTVRMSDYYGVKFAITDIGL